MSFFSGAVHLLGDVAAPVIKGVGAIVPGSEGERLSNIGASIANPNVTASNGLSSLLDPSKTAFAPVVRSVNSNVAAQSGNAPTPPPDRYVDPGTSASSIPAYDPALFDQATATANAGLGRLDNQQAIGTQNVLDSYTTAYNALLGQKAIADRNYQTTKDQTAKDWQGTKNTIDAGVGQKASSLQRLLASHGAGDTSAAWFNAPQAAAQQGATQRAQAGNTFAKNNQALDTSYGDFGNNYNNSVTGLGHQRDQNINNVKSQVESNRASLLQQLAGIAQQRAQAQGMTPEQIAAATNPYQTQINSILGNVDNLARNYGTPVQQGAPLTYQTPTLDSYNYNQAAGAKVANPNALTDAVSPYLSLLTGKKQQQQIF